MGLCDRRMGPYFSERNAMIQFPPMETFDDGELKDGKKLAKKILEEAG